MQDAYLLTWNPKRWKWDDLEEAVSLTGNGEPFFLRWSCGVRTHLQSGSRVFLLRQGVRPKGIIGVGVSVGAPHKDRHWDQKRLEPGKTAWYVEVQFERLLNPDRDEILELSKLKTGRLADVNWNTQASGIEIGEAAEALEHLWRQYIYICDFQDVCGEEPFAVEGGVRLAYRRHRNRERWLRDEKIARWLKTHDGRLPCEVCRFDFVDVYGEIGKGYAQVHHNQPLSDRTLPSKTRLSDLSILCANCHAMVHQGGKVRPIKSLLNFNRTKSN